MAQTNIRTITMDNGFTEIQWGRGDSDESISGYLQITPEGHLCFPFRREADDEAFVAVIGEKPGSVQIYYSEDTPPGDNPLVFNSDDLEVPA